MITRTLGMLCLAAFWGHAAYAQEMQDPFERSFYQVVPNPTGKNGYEELVMAGDLALASKALAALEQAGPPGPRLTAIRDALAQPELARARKLLQHGLAKSVFSPRETIDDETRIPEIAGFRSLAQMLGYQMYVDCADGRVDRAIDALREGLRLGYVVQTDSLISGLVGIASNSITLAKFSMHLDQLSARDCDRLLGVVREWLRQPNPAVGVLNAERRGVATLLRKYRSDPGKLLANLSSDPEGENPKAEAVRAFFANNPGSASAVVDQAGVRMEAHFGRLMAEVAKPHWHREPLPAVEDNSPAGMFCGLLGPDLMMVLESYAREQAKVQLLGVYAAVRRYRWEYQKLPATLAELKLGALVIDPFNGHPFEYKPTTEREFELKSIGPLDRREGAEPGSRRPLSAQVRPRP